MELARASERPGALTAKFLAMEPTALVDDVVNAVNDYICDSADTLEDFLANDLAGVQKDEHDSGELAKETANRVYECLRSTFHKNLKKLELFIASEVLHVPADLHVPELEDAPPRRRTDEEIAELDAQVAELRKKLMGARCMRQAMNAEMASLGSEEFRQLKDFAENLKPLNRPLPELGAQTMEEGMQKLVEQAGELRDLQAKIEPALREFVEKRPRPTAQKPGAAEVPEDRLKRRRAETQTAENAGQDLANLQASLAGSR